MLITQSISTIVNTLRQDGIIAYPTEAVFGLGCNPYSKTAVQRLLTVKQRSIDKGLIIIAANIQQIRSFIALDPSEISNKIEAAGKQPITWLIPAAKDTPKWLTGKFSSIAIRITHHLASQKLCEAYGQALVSTSANPSHLPPAKTIDEVEQYFNHHIDSCFDAELGNYKKPSEIRDILTGDIIRHG